MRRRIGPTLAPSGALLAWLSRCFRRPSTLLSTYGRTRRSVVRRPRPSDCSILDLLSNDDRRAVFWTSLQGVVLAKLGKSTKCRVDVEVIESKLCSRPVLRIIGRIAHFKNLHETTQGDNLRLPSRESGQMKSAGGVFSQVTEIGNPRHNCETCKTLDDPDYARGLLVIWNAPSDQDLSISLRRFRCLSSWKDTDRH